MTTRPTIGRGYRRLRPGERLRKGDEFLSKTQKPGEWLKAYPGGYAGDTDHTYRRRKPKKKQL